MGAKYCDECVCLSVSSHTSKTTKPNLTIFVHVAYGPGLVLLWWRCSMLLYFRFCGWDHVFK